MLKQITLKEAFDRMEKGEAVRCLAPSVDKGWEYFSTAFLQDILEEVICLAEFEEEADEPEKPAKKLKDPTEKKPKDLEEKPLKERAGMSGTGKAKIELDKGKLRALWKAGWSAEKIADEMNISTSTVYYHTKKFAYEEARKAEKEAEESNHD